MQTAACQGISGVFTFLAIFISCHHVCWFHIMLPKFVLNYSTREVASHFNDLILLQVVLILRSALFNSNTNICIICVRYGLI